MWQRNITAQRPWRLAALLLTALGLVAGVPVAAQSGRGTLTGLVMDTSGAIIPGASLTLKEIGTGSSYDSLSSGQGLYTFPELQPGIYTLSVTFPKFESYTQSGITVSVGSTSTVNAILSVGAATQSIIINGDASHLQSESSDIGTTVPTELIEDLPLQFNGTVRNPLQFVTLTPGYWGVVTSSPTSQGGF